MGEQSSDAMNLDLNLGPSPDPAAGSITNEALNLDDWIEEPFHRVREVVRHGARQRWRWRHLRINPPEPHRSFLISPEAHADILISPEAQNVSMELNHLLVNPSNGNALQAGEGSVAAEDRAEESPKACENNNGITEDEASDKKDDVEKGSGSDGSFFDCNICLDLARDPVVTCCGHLFCWPCLYRWLHVHSDAKECPICKGEVTFKNVTPIYGRGNNVREPDEDPSLKVPLRPHARRVESLRQTLHRNAFAFPVEEMIRRLGSRIDLSRDIVQPHEPDNGREIASTTLLNRILTSRALRREHNHGAAPDDDVDLTQNNIGSPEAGHNRRIQSLLRQRALRRGHYQGAASDDVVDLTQNNIGSPEAGDNRRVQSLLLRRTQSHRTTLSSLSTALSSAERFVEAYIRSNSIGRNQEQPPPVDDRDSFSSVAAVDTAVEIDSMVSLSTSSSRRRNDTSRVSDVDSGDSRAPRRRRLN